ncbi:DNA polymerase III subunit beta [Prochlorococcus marinus]|uniref:Beta sliding clamp n=1 Tax=Prochlorococcus marinus XMU1408 TaxID=2213228 RepID=A0A318R789_PROMR|nr:DNA polymerase III subunit beta [Prochlorococcus marinus]MBW3042980.1 DNA polymerase III subunit beta [Prochlorococcus marinus str. XMU1408]PYE03610.1 DNA polymerase III subunit beta [Prochlorococcus marinus XMU1408]
MKLSCSQSELNAALQLVSRAVSSRPTHPVLANVLLAADEVTGKVRLTGFDLSLGIQTSISASIENSGAITLPAKIFGEIISKLSNDSPLILKLDDNSQQIELTSKSGTYHVRGMLADDFPDLPLVESGTSLKLNPLLLSSAIKSTLFSSSTDDAKQLLTGVNLTFDGYGLESAATDGHRLAILNLNNILSQSNDENISTSIDKFSITLPSKSLREVEKFLSTCDINQPINFFIDKGQVVFISADEIITIRALEGSYPNYSQLLPETFENILEFDRKEFIASLERIAVLADQHNNVIKITTDSAANVIRISTDAQDIGTGFESLPISFKGESFQIAFNVRYLLDGLKVIDSNLIKLSCNAPTTPAVFSPINSDLNFTYLVMPIQIRN